MNTNKENLTPFVVEVYEERRVKVVVYGTDFDDALNIAHLLRDDEIIRLDDGPSRQHFMLQGQATEEDMQACSGLIFDRNGEVHIPTETDYLERAKSLIHLFCLHADKGDETFSDLENVGLAYTDLEESEHGSYKVTVTADLIHLKIRTCINDILVSTIACGSLKELCDEHLDYLDFDDLVYITDEEWRTFCNTVAENNRKRVPELRTMFPKGTRIRLLKMVNDPQPIEPGSTGTVDYVDGIGQLQMNWDCHRSLALIPGADLLEVISRPQ